MRRSATDTGGHVDLAQHPVLTPPTPFDGLIDPDAVRDLASVVARATAVQPVGARTQWGIGGVPKPGTEVTPPIGIVPYDPAELTITVGAGTTVADLEDALGAYHHEVGLDPRDPSATVGGVLAAGLSGHRRLRHGPLRDRVLEIRFITGDGRVIKCGGPTVKNVSGYDIARLLVGSMGTLGVIMQATLRARPRPRASIWATTTGDVDHLRRNLFRPSCLAYDGTTTYVLLEGHTDDLGTEISKARLELAPTPTWPSGTSRGRISVQARHVLALGTALDAIDGLRWMAEIGVGTVHVAADDVGALLAARTAAHANGGWMLRESGASEIDGFGLALPNAALTQRIRDALDPARKMAPGRIPR